MRGLIFALFLVLFLAAGAFWFLFSGGTVQEAKDMAAQMNPFAASKLIPDLTRKAEGGDRHAQIELAALYAKGVKGVPRDYGKALEWYYKAAQQGDPTAQFEIGRMYEKGEGVGQDNFRAAEWYRIAAGPGKNAAAQFALGQMYSAGRGVPNDYDQAVRYYRVAADQGHAPAQFLLGAMYAEGWGIAQDTVEAYKWFSLAMDNEAAVIAVNNKYQPTIRRNELAVKMNRAQIAEADKAIKAWRDAHKRK